MTPLSQSFETLVIDFKASKHKYRALRNYFRQKAVLSLSEIIYTSRPIWLFAITLRIHMISLTVK